MILRRVFLSTLLLSVHSGCDYTEFVDDTVIDTDTPTDDTDTATELKTDTGSSSDTGFETDTEFDTDTDTADTSKEIAIFYESFEDPDVTGTTTTYPHGWITTSHPDYVGLNDVDSGLFTTPFGEQAMKIYGDATATTSDAILSAIFEANRTYTVTFNVAKRNDKAVTGYVVELLSIDDLNEIETILVTAKGSSVNTTDMSTWGSIVFEARVGSTNLGKRIAIRLKKHSDINWNSNPQFDNVLLTREGNSPRSFVGPLR